MQVKGITKETGNTENSTYTEVTHADRCHTKRLSETNNANNNYKENKHEKLCLISLTNQFRRQGRNLNKKASNINTSILSNIKR